MNKSPIAIMVAALLLGTQISIAALDESAASEATEAVENVTATETIAQPEQAAADQSEPKEQVAAEQAAPVVSAEPQPAAVRPVTWKSDVFPASGDEAPTKLPFQIAYLDRLEQDRIATGRMIARGDAFPSSADEDYMKRLPSVAAYFDRIERQRAALQTAQAEADSTQTR